MNLLRDITEETYAQIQRLGEGLVDAAKDYWQKRTELNALRERLEEKPSVVSSYEEIRQYQSEHASVATAYATKDTEMALARKNAIALRQQLFSLLPFYIEFTISSRDAKIASPNDASTRLIISYYEFGAGWRSEQI